jgi:SAM-dependent methyltransferase
MKVFQENLTSKILQQNSSSLVNKQKKEIDILEIGCGDGNITNHIIKKRKKNHNFYLSDISIDAVRAAKKNIKYKKCTFRIGKWLNPWKDKRFDIIISDVASINDFIAKKSPWYKGLVCNSGSDGLKNIEFIINIVNKNLKKNGKFILPIISLSNEKKLLKLLEAKFIKISYTKKIVWPIPKFFKKNIDQYIKLKKENKINFQEKFGMHLAHTYSAICTGLK